MEDPTPRVNFETMQRFHNQKVIICCQVSQIDNGRVKVLTSDKGEVTVLAGSTPYEGRFVEVLGTVVNPNTIQEEMHTNLAENFNLDLYNELVKLSHKNEYASMFSS